MPLRIVEIFYYPDLDPEVDKIVKEQQTIEFYQNEYLAYLKAFVEDFRVDIIKNLFHRNKYIRQISVANQLEFDF